MRISPWSRPFRAESSAYAAPYPDKPGCYMASIGLPPTHLFLLLGHVGIGGDCGADVGVRIGRVGGLSGVGFSEGEFW